MQRLPLFPLRQVLVPGLVLPLHVFEPRYRALVTDLLDRPPQERAFGVVALRQGRDAGTAHDASHLHAVGCTALVREHEELPDGRFALVTAGAVRFRLHQVDESAGTPYLTGLVTPLDEPDAATDEGDGTDDGADLDVLTAEVARRWSVYRSRLGIAATGLPERETPAPVVLSYLVVAGMVLDLPERQALLEIPDTTARLRAEKRLLHREDVLITELRSLPAIDLASTEVNPN